MAKKNIVSSAVLYGTASALMVASVASLYQPGVALAAPVATTAQSVSVDIDEKVATDVAANFALQTDMPVAANVANLSTSLGVKKDLSQTNELVISKPQIVQPTGDIRTIVTYKAKEGDNVQSVAQRFNLTPETIKWANNLASDNLEAGRDLTILPTDGVAYTVKDGDSIQSIADKYKAPGERIISYNDLEVGGIKKDMRIVIPGGVLPENERPGYTPPSNTRTNRTNNAYAGTTSTGNATAYSGGVDYSKAKASAGNAYAPGNCTWYAYERRAQLGRPIGSFWGNASTWAVNGAAAGFTVNTTPAPGAIMQNGGGYAGYGHVAIVESLNPDGSITVSEMNYAGFNVVSSRNVPASALGNYKFIH